MITPKINESLIENRPLRHKYVARQPIFDRDKKVIAYEILFRSGFDKLVADFSDHDGASSKTLADSFLLFDIKDLAGGKKAFINFSRNILLSDSAAAFPPDLMVLELLETIEPDKDVLDACVKLKQKGYKLALDDFVFHPNFNPILEFMDIVKIDFLKTSEAEQRNIFQQVNRPNIKFLAEKIETMETFLKAKEIGYSYFQGFFFSKPVVIEARDIPSVKANLLKLLNRIYLPDADFNEIEDIIKKDVSLAYKLIRFINSVSFSFPVEVHSILHVLNLLGLKELRKWISLVVLSQLSYDEPEELMITSIIRARFCELIAPHIGWNDRSPELFLMGLFSLIDVFFERPMNDILKELPLLPEIKEALVNGTGLFGNVLNFVKSYEKGDWEKMFHLASILNLDEEIIPQLYFESIVWADKIKVS